MQVAVGLWWEARDNFLMFPRLNIRMDDITDEVSLCLSG